MKPWPYPLWIAHRGAGKLAPENTLAAFRLGAEYGFRMFECDAKLSADGVPFLLHDSALERTSNGHGVAGDLPWTALSRLDAGAWHSRRYAGEPLASLEGLIRFCLANRHALNIEIKPTPGLERPTGEAVARHAAMLWTDPTLPPPLLTSFQPDALQGALTTCSRASTRPAARHAVGRLARHGAATALFGDRLQLRAVGRLDRGAGACGGHARAELHRQRRMGRATIDCARHRRDHHGSGRQVQSGRLIISAPLVPSAGCAPSMMKT